MKKILGYSIYSGTKDECIERILSREKVHVVSGNPEVLYKGLNNEVLGSSFKNEDVSLIIPDGVGVMLSAKIKGIELSEKIAGIEVMQDLINRFNDTGGSIYILGSSSENVKSCVENLKGKFENLNICGYRNGFFSKDNESSIVDELNRLKPTAVFVAMGCPKQEEFIIRNMDSINCKVFMGVGGSVDVLAGKINRAPRWMISCGLEWLYRVLLEPKRIIRLGSIPKFLLKVMCYKEE